MHPTISRLAIPLLALTMLSVVPGTGEAGAAGQQPPAARRAAPPVPPPPPPPAVEPVARPPLEDADAQQVHDRLNQLFEQYPPALRRVLRLDPSLLTSQEYLAPYPGLARFVADHPEVAHNPAYFVGTPEWDTPERPASDAVRIFERFSEGAVIMTIFLVVAGTLVWLARTLIDYRRWLRMSKVQAEVHTKLLDRFTTSEDLLAYIQTPSGRRFLESAPLPLDAAPTKVGAPLGRILWSIQVGMVLACAGVGLLIVSQRTIAEVASLLSVMGVLALALGAGFVLSAGLSWVLSKRLGLLEPAATETGN